VTALCRLTAQGDFMPSSSFSTTSDGTPRMVEVTGATVTVEIPGLESARPGAPACGEVKIPTLTSQDQSQDGIGLFPRR
jgi:hypothetical protein